MQTSSLTSYLTISSVLCSLTFALPLPQNWGYPLPLSIFLPPLRDPDTAASALASTPTASASRLDDGDYPQESFPSATEKGCLTSDSVDSLITIPGTRISTTTITVAVTSTTTISTTDYANTASISTTSPLLQSSPASFLAQPTSTPTSTPTPIISRAISNGGPEVTNPAALLWYDPLSGNGAGSSDDEASPKQYVCYSGPASQFPNMNEWSSFDAMWRSLSRDAFGPVGDSAEEMDELRNAVLSVSEDAKVDARVVLAVVMDESTGNVRVGCTNNGIQNCGLMQSHDPQLTTFDPTHGAVSIRQMIVDGVQGTAAGPGLVQLLNESGDVYTALRMYNSGSANAEDLSDPVGATAAYVSNVGNYLRGWDGVVGEGGGGPEGCGFV